MDQEKLKRLIRRRHPEYEESIPHWQFLNACYKGGRAWFKDNIFKYLKEGETEYSDRVNRAYRFNHSKEVVDLVDKYLFKTPINRNLYDCTDEVKTFWENATHSGLTIDQFARQISRKSSIFGSIWVVVDSSLQATEDANASVADIKEDDGKIFAYTVNPDRALDFAYDDNGKLIWILIQEQVRDSDDPFESTGDTTERYRLWTRDEWFLLEATKKTGTQYTAIPVGYTGTLEGDDIVVDIVDQGVHGLGEVPVFRVDNAISDEPWKAPSLIGDIAYLDKAVANYLSNLDAIIQDQTFSQLAMPAQGLMPGESGYDKMLEMGTKRIFLYDGERGGEPKYIAPDPKQANVILGVISKIINEIYHTVGMAGERTKEDNAVGIDNSSGVAKAFDFERVNALLVSKASSLEQAERKLVRLVNLWAGNKGFDETVVQYSKSFDVRGLADEFAIAAQLALIDAPDTIRREQMNGMVDKLFPMLEKEIKNKIESELKGWPVKLEQVSPQGSLLGPGKPAKAKTAGGDKAKKQNATNK